MCANTHHGIASRLVDDFSINISPPAGMYDDGITASEGGSYQIPIGMRLNQVIGWGMSLKEINYFIPKLMLQLRMSD